MTAGERKAFREGMEEGYVRAVDWFEKKLTGNSGLQIVELHGMFGEDLRFDDIKAEALAGFRPVRFAPRKRVKP